MKYKIKELRLKRKMSQQELAEASGVSRGIIVRLETEKEVETTIGTVEKLAKALNVTPGYLLLPDND